MQTNRHVLRDHRFLPASPDPAPLKEWFTRHFKNETAAGAVLALTAAVTLWILAVRLYQGVQSYTIYTY